MIVVVVVGLTADQDPDLVIDTGDLVAVVNPAGVEAGVGVVAMIKMGAKAQDTMKPGNQNQSKLSSVLSYTVNSLSFLLTYL